MPRKRNKAQAMLYGCLTVVLFMAFLGAAFWTGPKPDQIKQEARVIGPALLLQPISDRHYGLSVELQDGRPATWASPNRDNVQPGEHVTYYMRTDSRETSLTEFQGKHPNVALGLLFPFGVLVFVFLSLSMRAARKHRYPPISGW